MQYQGDGGSQQRTCNAGSRVPNVSSASTSRDHWSPDDRSQGEVFGGGRGAKRRRRRRRRTAAATGASEAEELTLHSEQKDRLVIIRRIWEEAPDSIPAAQGQHDQTRAPTRYGKNVYRRGKWNKARGSRAGANRVSDNISPGDGGRECAAVDGDSGRTPQQPNEDCPVTRGRGRGRGRGGRLTQHTGSGAVLIPAVQRQQETTETPSATRTHIGRLSNDITTSHDRRTTNSDGGRGRGRGGRGGRGSQQRPQQSAADESTGGRGRGLPVSMLTGASPIFPVVQQRKQDITGHTASNTRHNRETGVLGGEPGVSRNVIAHNSRSNRSGVHNGRDTNSSGGAASWSPRPIPAVRVFTRGRGGNVTVVQRPQQPRQDSGVEGRESTVRSGGASTASAPVVSGGNLEEARRRAQQSPANADAEDSSDSGHRERLSEQLTAGTLDCLVCYEPVRPSDSVWSCTSCHNVLHLNCTRQWALSSADVYFGSWPCPACRHRVLTIPTEYRCWCGKQCNPEPSTRRVPHSCGATCGRLRKVVCVHRCELTCHPGPCPPCTVQTNSPCGCGRQSAMLCGQLMSCGAVCGRRLNCRRHSCRRQCHRGPCGECLTVVSLACRCGHCEAVCAYSTWSTPSCLWNDINDTSYKTADPVSNCCIL